VLRVTYKTNLSTRWADERSLVVNTRHSYVQEQLHK